MTQQKPPAGWYDDPAGSGGRRYWNGRNWTDQVQRGAAAKPTPAPGGSRARDRVPDGYMMLNGERVPLGQMTPPSSSTPSAFSSNRGAIVAVVISLLVVALLALGSRIAPNQDLDLGDWSDDGGDYAALYTLEVDSRDGTGVDLIWSDGTDEYTETAVDPGWSTDIGAGDGGVSLIATANDGQDVPTCRILDADGDVLVEFTASPGGTATCRWDG